MAYKRLVINVSPELHEQLGQMANERGITVETLIRRAIAFDLFLYEHRDAELILGGDNGYRLIIRKEQD